MTKDGVEYNFNITPYVIDIDYGNLTLKYKFSSELYKQKFLENRNSFSNRTNNIMSFFNIDFRILKDIKLYTKVEKRGFQLVKNNNQPFYSIEELKVKAIFDII